jgi:hypothetical protein
MYGRIFSSMFTGSMVGAGSDVFAVWAYAIANKDKNGAVDLNPKLLAFVIGCGTDDVEVAVEFLCAPDENSRSKKDGGTRLVREGTYSYRIVNDEDYKKIHKAEDKSDYDRIRYESKKTGGFPAEDEQPVKPKKKPVDWQEQLFAQFWSVYPRKVSKEAAIKAWKSMPEDDRALAADAIPNHARVFKAQARPKDRIPHPATWLNGKQWNDDLEGEDDTRESLPAGSAPAFTPISELDAPAVSKLNKKWDAISDEIQETASTEEFETFIKPFSVAGQDMAGELVVGCPNQVVVEWTTDHVFSYMDGITAIVDQGGENERR